MCACVTMNVEHSTILSFHRMVENQRDKPLFKDQREIEVAVDYMKGSGKFVLCVCISISVYVK